METTGLATSVRATQFRSPREHYINTDTALFEGTQKDRQTKFKHQESSSLFNERQSNAVMPRNLPIVAAC